MKRSINEIKITQKLNKDKSIKNKNIFKNVSLAGPTFEKIVFVFLLKITLYSPIPLKLFSYQDDILKQKFLDVNYFHHPKLLY